MFNFLYCLFQELNTKNIIYLLNYIIKQQKKRKKKIIYKLFLSIRTFMNVDFVGGSLLEGDHILTLDLLVVARMGICG